ncbi:hypothetical protein Tco_0280437 [Tanacetum coccineum]
MRNRNSCSLCGGTNHNKRTCTGMFKDQDEVVVAQDEVVQEKDVSLEGKDVGEEDLSKPFKEKLKTPLTRRIIEFVGPEYVMPTNITLYDGSTDPADHLNRFSDGKSNSGEWLCRFGVDVSSKHDGGARGWFEILPLNSINEWYQLREAFTTRYSIRRACYKEPYEITKVVRRANETLPAFKERWTVETGLIMGVPEVMKISESRTYIVAYPLYTEPRDVSSDIGPFQPPQEMTETNRSGPKKELQGNYYKNPNNERDNFHRGRHRDYRAPYPQRDQANKAVPVLSLDSLIKCPKEILATETQLQLPAPRPVENPLRTGDPDKYCDYHQDKDHHTNDCIQLRKQLEIALESGKLNHLMKDLRQRVGRGQGRNPPPPPKVINMVRILSSKEKKRKDREATGAWMNTPITFLGVVSDDASDEPLIIEARVEGYLVRRVYVDEGSSVEVMFEHCFENLPAKVSPLSKGKATIWRTRATIIAKCRLREGKQILTEKQPEIHEAGQPDEGGRPYRSKSINPCFPRSNYYQ